jgi:hypothetical protein
MTRAHRIVIPLAALALAACGQGGQPDSNSLSTANAVEQVSAGNCAPPALAMADNAQLESALMDETKANFATAFKSACGKGLLTGKPLVDPKATDQGMLFLINAPEANVASIYLSDVDGSRMMLEYPFLTIDGKSQVPSSDELEEAIYCAVVGATPEEQESTGRCLVD